MNKILLSYLFTDNPYWDLEIKQIGINYVDKDSFLTCAIKLDDEDEKITEENKIELVQLLIDLGTDVNITVYDEYNLEITPLNVAVQRSYEISKLLIDNGADPNYIDINSTTMLLYAAENKSDDYRVVEMILNLTNNINDRNVIGFSALTMASEIGNINIVKFLLDNGINTNIEDGGINFEIVQPLYNNHIDIVKLIAKRDNINLTTLLFNEEENILFFIRDAKILQEMIDQGADVNHLNIDNNNALQKLTYIPKDNPLIFTLIDNGIDINNINDEGYTFISILIEEYIRLFHIIMRFKKPDEIAPLLQSLAAEYLNLFKILFTYDTNIVLHHDTILTIHLNMLCNFKENEIAIFEDLSHDIIILFVFEDIIDNIPNININKYRKELSDLYHDTIQVLINKGMGLDEALYFMNNYWYPV